MASEGVGGSERTGSRSVAAAQASSPALVGSTADGGFEIAGAGLDSAASSSASGESDLVAHERALGLNLLVELVGNGGGEDHFRC